MMASPSPSLSLCLPSLVSHTRLEAMEMGTEAEYPTLASPVSGCSSQAPAPAPAQDDARMTALVQLVETQAVQLQQRDAQLALLREGTLWRDSRVTGPAVLLAEKQASRYRVATGQQLAPAEDALMHESVRLKELAKGPVLQNAQLAEVPVSQNSQLAKSPVLQIPQHEGCQSCKKLGAELQQMEAQLVQRGAQIRALAQRGQQARSARLGTETELRCAKAALSAEQATCEAMRTLMRRSEGSLAGELHALRQVHATLLATSGQQRAALEGTRRQLTSARGAEATAVCRVAAAAAAEAAAREAAGEAAAREAAAHGAAHAAEVAALMEDFAASQSALKAEVLSGRAELRTGEAELRQRQVAAAMRHLAQWCALRGAVTDFNRQRAATARRRREGTQALLAAAAAALRAAKEKGAAEHAQLWGQLAEAVAAKAKLQRELLTFIKVAHFALASGACSARGQLILRPEHSDNPPLLHTRGMPAQRAHPSSPTSNARGGACTGLSCRYHQ